MSLLDPEYADLIKDNPEKQFGTAGFLLDLQHHDVPERHMIGTTLFAPNIVNPEGTAAVVGKSLAPAREDHVHPSRGPLGRIAVGTVLNAGATTTCNAGVATDLTNTVTFTPLTGRFYRAVYIARAWGPNVNPNDSAFAVRIWDGAASVVMDDWQYTHQQWGHIHVARVFAGDGASKTWKVRADGPPNVQLLVWSSEWYIEDIGTV